MSNIYFLGLYVFLIIFYRAKQEGVHKEFQKSIQAGICRYLEDKGVLAIISRYEMTQKRALMLQEMHFRNLTQKVRSFFQKRNDIYFQLIRR